MANATKKAAPGPAAKKAPQMNIRLVKDDAGKIEAVKYAIKNAGKAGRIFLLNSDGDFVKVVQPSEFVATWLDKTVAHSKRGLDETKVKYLSAKCEVEEKSRVVIDKSITKETFAAYQKLVNDGALKTKRSRKSELVVVPLV